MRIETAFQRAHHRGSDSGRVPVHSYDATECLEPERVAQSRQKLGWAVGEHDVFGNGGAELRHATGEPRRHTTAMKREAGCSRAFHRMIIARGKRLRMVTF